MYIFCCFCCYFFINKYIYTCFQLTHSACYFLSQEQRIKALQARVGTSEQALAALERTATEQMEGLTQQSSQALDRLQKQLGQAYSQLEQLHCFIKVLHCTVVKLGIQSYPNKIKSYLAPVF